VRACTAVHFVAEQCEKAKSGSVLAIHTALHDVCEHATTTSFEELTANVNKVAEGLSKAKEAVLELAPRDNPDDMWATTWAEQIPSWEADISKLKASMNELTPGLREVCQLWCVAPKDPKRPVESDECFTKLSKLSKKVAACLNERREATVRAEAKQRRAAVAAQRKADKAKGAPAATAAKWKGGKRGRDSNGGEEPSRDRMQSELIKTRNRVVTTAGPSASAAPASALRS
jgi:hypothetical protein